MKTYKTILTTLSVFTILSIVYVGNGSAHCDTLDGPVVAMARIALDKGDVTPLLKWVRAARGGKGNPCCWSGFQKTLAIDPAVPRDRRLKNLPTCTFLKPWSGLKEAHRTGQGKERPTPA